MADQPHLDENGFVILDEPDADDPHAIPAHINRTAIDDCRDCDGDGYRGAAVCDHRDHRAAAARGMALVRDALAKPPKVALREAGGQYGASGGDA